MNTFWKFCRLQEVLGHYDAGECHSLMLMSIIEVLRSKLRSWCWNGEVKLDYRRSSMIESYCQWLSRLPTSATIQDSIWEKDPFLVSRCFPSKSLPKYLVENSNLTPFTDWWEVVNYNSSINYQVFLRCIVLIPY